MSATVTIIGGHGKVALLTAPLLGAGGHDVRSVIRDPAQVDAVGRTGAEPVVLDVAEADETSVAAVLDGSDVVVWSAGAGGGDAARTYAVDRDAAVRTMDAAASAGVRRFVMVSYFGAGADHGVPADDPFFAYAEAKAAADAYLRDSGLAWTILGPSRLTLEPPTGRIEIPRSGGGPGKGEVSRANVAAVIAATVDRDDLAGHTVEFNDGDAPIAEALAAVAG